MYVFFCRNSIYLYTIHVKFHNKKSSIEIIIGYTLFGMIEKDTLLVGCSDDLGWIIGYLSYLTADLD